MTVIASALLLTAELAWRGHFVAAPVVVLLVVALGLHWRRTLRMRPESPRRLLLAADGRFHVMTVGGGVDPVHLDPAGIRLGRHLLLLLRGGGRYRLLLGPDNVEPAVLAALGRRLAGAVAPAATAIHSASETDPGAGRLP